jgi:cytidine deaminase
MEQFVFEYQHITQSTLSPTIVQLVTMATEATESAYAPYSQFKVGAAVLLENGNILTGSNHENASYPVGICAERSILSTLNPLYAHHKIKAIAVSYKSEQKNASALSPCGMCRQAILEIQLAQKSPIEIYMCSPSGAIIHVPDASYLLPFYFSNAML